MPDLREAVLYSAPDLRILRVSCDGYDGPAPAEECTQEDILVLALQGRFAFRNRSTKALIGPSGGLVLRAGQPYTITHPHRDGDVCLSIRGSGLLPLVEGDHVIWALPPDGYLRRQRLLWRLAAGEPVARLEIEEELFGAMTPAEQLPLVGSHRDRAIAQTIAFALESRFDERLLLTDLASTVGVSIFHACRAFRRTMGTSIHRYQQEMRLRHALALLLGTQMPPARIAIDKGFANQGHFGNAFRRRFGVPPGQARRDMWGFGNYATGTRPPRPR